MLAATDGVCSRAASYIGLMTEIPRQAAAARAPEAAGQLRRRHRPARRRGPGELPQIHKPDLLSCEIERYRRLRISVLA